jgi:hypothetical protein
LRLIWVLSRRKHLHFKTAHSCGELELLQAVLYDHYSDRALRVIRPRSCWLSVSGSYESHAGPAGVGEASSIIRLWRLIVVSCQKVKMASNPKLMNPITPSARPLRLNRIMSIKIASGGRRWVAAGWLLDGYVGEQGGCREGR